MSMRFLMAADNLPAALSISESDTPLTPGPTLRRSGRGDLRV
jgi:hypothetical protein